MKAEDIVAQAILVAKKFNHLKATFVGDGDSIALAIVHLSGRGLLTEAPDYIRVLDFDQRIVNAINRFAELHGYSQIIAAELYNVVDPLPESLIGKAGAFYTNPPWGASNGGESVVAFLRRGVEAVGQHGLAAVVGPNESRVPWTQEVVSRTKSALVESGFVIEKVGPERHHYHLDDDPHLRSCTLFARGVAHSSKKIARRRLNRRSFRNFYGRNNHLRVKFVLECDPQERGSRGLSYRLELL
jgi:N4-bis(aminopropyl)spermidine synthase